MKSESGERKLANIQKTNPITTANVGGLGPQQMTAAMKLNNLLLRKCSDWPQKKESSYSIKGVGEDFCSWIARRVHLRRRDSAPGISNEAEAETLVISSFPNHAFLLLPIGKRQRQEQMRWKLHGINDSMDNESDLLVAIRKVFDS